MEVTKKVKITPMEADSTHVFRATAVFRIPKEVTLDYDAADLIEQLTGAPLMEQHFDSRQQEIFFSNDRRTIVVSLAADDNLPQGSGRTIDHDSQYSKHVNEANRIFDHIEFVVNEILEGEA